METSAFSELSAALTGEVVRAGHTDYDRLRRTFIHLGAPEAIVTCRTAADVALAVGFAREHGLAVSVRAGGHHHNGFATNDGGLIIDVSPLNEARVLDADARVVRIGAGGTWGPAATALAGHGLAVSSGDTASVGVGGLTLGGGIGWLVRKYGLAIDSLVGAEVVTADGRVLRVDAEEHPDLFWAIRGGGGNFGVATSFDFVARQVPRVFYGTIMYPTKQAARVLKGWAEYMRTATEELSVSAARYPPLFGDFPLMLTVCYGSADEDAFERAIEPLLSLGDLQGRDINLIPYPGVLVEVPEMTLDNPPRYRNRFVRTCTEEFVDAAVTTWEKSDNLFVELRGLGGAMNRVPADATAFAHRDSEILTTAVNMGSAEGIRESMPVFDAFWQAVAPFTDGAYGNLMNEIDDDDVTNVYPAATRARLAAVKAGYDPENLFRHNVNIEPA